MSRVIIKGLPKGIKDERLQNLFQEVGTVTDCSLKYTKDGVFRKFGFIGFSSEQEAKASIKHFNRSFIDTSRITVEIAKDFGDATKPRAWSKYSRDSSAYERMRTKLENKQEKQNKKTTKDRANKVDEMLGDLKDDSEFQEFVEAHKNKTTKATWSNDTGVTAGNAVITSTSAASGDGGPCDNEEACSAEMPTTGPTAEEALMESSDERAKNAGVSDAEYLKSKMACSGQNILNSNDSASDNTDPSSSDSELEAEDEKANLRIKKIKDAKPESESDNDDRSRKNDGREDETLHTSSNVSHVIKMKGLPSTIREKQVTDFFLPLKAVRVKIPKNAKGRATNCVATVEFSSQKDTDQGMRKNKNFIGPKRIFLYKVKRDVTEAQSAKPRLWEQKKDDNDAEEETIAESGRLYVRNLSYGCEEEHLEAFFGKYGPLSEVHLPLDSVTRKIKGFAFVTFMMPEHAVQAYTELDGTAFQGRMLHILPAKPKREDDLEITDAMSFKQKKEIKQRQHASSSHNWNALFLGTSAVADVMADRYGATKSQILDPGVRQSLGVRMALGETQLVNETKQFLIDNGVSLDAFGQAASARSKTVLLVKNLPAGTTQRHLRTLFAAHGVLGRVVLPPSGITGIVEFQEPTEARAAFRSLAYTKFQHLPLYLEWAPVDALKGSNKPEKCEQPEPQEPAAAGEASGRHGEAGPSEPGKDQAGPGVTCSEDEEADEPEPDSTIYVKNLNFDSNEQSLKQHFSGGGEVHLVTIAKKKDVKNPGQLLSMGYGFVQFKTKAAAQKAIKTLQHSQLDEHQLELKASNKRIGPQILAKKKQDVKKKQTSTKIIVRNVPFEATHKEIKQLFSTFGELKTVRLPKKLGGTGSHRGFCFVDFLTKQDAKRAFSALCVSTRLYGRRLVLEWADGDETVEQLRRKTAHHFHDEVPAKRLRKSALMDELKLSAD